MLNLPIVIVLSAMTERAASTATVTLALTSQEARCTRVYVYIIVLDCGRDGWQLIVPVTILSDEAQQTDTPCLSVYVCVCVCPAVGLKN